jgi:hypothetical protein
MLVVCLFMLLVMLIWQRIMQIWLNNMIPQQLMQFGNLVRNLLLPLGQQNTQLRTYLSCQEYHFQLMLWNHTNWIINKMHMGCDLWWPRYAEHPSCCWRYAAPHLGAARTCFFVRWHGPLQRAQFQHPHVSRCRHRHPQHQAAPSAKRPTE